MNTAIKIMFSSFFCFFVSRLSANSQPQPTVKDVQCQVFMVCASIYALSDAYAKWYPKENPEIICKNCKQRRLSLGELSGALIIKALKDIAYEENSTWTQNLINNFIELMTEGTFVELEQFLRRTMNKIEYRCCHCNGTVWENVSRQPSAAQLPATTKQPVIDENVNQQILVLGAYLYALKTAGEKYSERYPNNDIQIICSNCKDKRVAMGELSGALIGETMRGIVERTGSFETMKNLFEQLIQLMSEGTFAELERFLLETTNEIQYKCSHCQCAIWEKIAAAAPEKTSAIVYKKRLHLSAQ
jgi:hypothetical protein